MCTHVNLNACKCWFTHVTPRTCVITTPALSFAVENLTHRYIPGNLPTAESMNIWLL